MGDGGLCVCVGYQRFDDMFDVQFSSAEIAKFFDFERENATAFPFWTLVFGNLSV